LESFLVSSEGESELNGFLHLKGLFVLELIEPLPKPFIGFGDLRVFDQFIIEKHQFFIIQLGSFIQLQQMFDEIHPDGNLLLRRDRVSGLMIGLRLEDVEVFFFLGHFIGIFTIGAELLEGAVEVFLLLFEGHIDVLALELAYQFLIGGGEPHRHGVVIDERDRKVDLVLGSLKGAGVADQHEVPEPLLHVLLDLVGVLRAQQLHHKLHVLIGRSGVLEHLVHYAIVVLGLQRVRNIRQDLKNLRLEVRTEEVQHRIELVQREVLFFAEQGEEVARLLQDSAVSMVSVEEQGKEVVLPQPLRQDLNRIGAFLLHRLDH